MLGLLQDSSVPRHQASGTVLHSSQADSEQCTQGLPCVDMQISGTQNTTTMLTSPKHGEDLLYVEQMSRCQPLVAV